ncbi:Crp/Fnr family transcriptional regulator [Actinosynnema sp. CS-041913]|uniref:Crp/Fnr family transcriptional regulator n=1 Tax=Actinosynnema sp. CS-041913 TaxID=3239917 RepID=UPI003D901CAB
MAHGTWRSGSLMSTLSPAAEHDLLTAGVSVRHPPGKVLLREGERSSHVSLLLSGYVKVTAGNSDGGVALLAIRGRGDLIGELAALDGQPRSATAVAADTVRARVLSSAAFHEFLLRHPGAAEAVSRSVAAKLRWSTQRRIDFTGCPVRTRVVRVLLELAADHGEPTAHGIGIGFPLTQPELAALVGAAEPTVHKVLADLRRRGLADTGYRSVTILDQGSMRALVEPHSGRPRI